MYYKVSIWERSRRSRTHRYYSEIPWALAFRFQWAYYSWSSIIVDANVQYSYILELKKQIKWWKRLCPTTFHSFVTDTFVCVFKWLVEIQVGSKLFGYVLAHFPWGVTDGIHNGLYSLHTRRRWEPPKQFFFYLCFRRLCTTFLCSCSYWLPAAWRWTSLGTQ